MTVLILGGCGFIGRNLTEFLSSKGFHVTVICKKIHDTVNGRIEYVEADITKRETLSSVFKNDIEVVIDLAGTIGGVQGSNFLFADPGSFINLNVHSTAILLEYAKKFGSRIIYASSEEVYGKNQDLPWKENSLKIFGDVKNPRQTFGLCKLLSENLLLSTAKSNNINSVILRLSNIYGKFQKPYLVIPRMITSSILEGNVKVYGNGAQKRSFLYIEDAVEAIYKLIINENIKNDIFNVGSSEEVTVEDLAREITSIAGLSDSNIEHLNITGDVMDSFEDIQRKVMDCSKIYEKTGWKPKTSLSNGLKSTFYWYESNKEWWQNYL
ncbi:MAG: NAD(P)-dependent oxidoreductase [Thermoplasmatales archaeon]